MNDWRERAINAFNAKREAEETEKRQIAENIENLREEMTAKKIRHIFDGPIVGLEGVKFKCVWDKSKIADASSAWTLYMGVERDHRDGDKWMPWYGPINTLEDVGAAFAHENMWDDYGAEPQDRAVAVRNQPEPNANERICQFALQMSTKGAENGIELTTLRALTEIAVQLERVAVQLERFESHGLTAYTVQP